MGLLSFLFGPDSKAEATCNICSQSFAQMWAAYNRRPLDSVPGPDAYAPRTAPVPSVLPPAARLVAIGDIHGDFGKAFRAFRLAGLVDEHGKWSGGDTVAVQVGDILDRGDHELRTLLFLERLAGEARAAGGALHLLNGNHETMNAMGDLRYATPGANVEWMAFSTWRDFNALMRRHTGCGLDEPSPLQDRLAAAAAASTSPASRMSALHPYNWLRGRALRPGGEVARRFLAPRPIVLQVGSWVFVHGGVLPAHVEYGLDRINSETQAWLLGDAAPGGGSAPPKPPPAPSFLRGASAIVWARAFSATDERRCDCDTLQSVLQSIPGAARMVVGHTIQSRGINSACEQRVIRVDVGMSRGCGDGPVEVLEVLGDTTVRRLREHGPPVEVAPPQPRGDHVHPHPHAHTQQGHGQGDKQQQQQPRVSAAA